MLAGVVLALGLPRTVFALDPDRAVTQYVSQAWDTDHGLPQNSIFSLVQTRDGYLWIGTQEGLVRFDGLHFKVYDRKNTPGIKQHDVRALYEDENGVLSIGTGRGGLVRYEGGVFTSIGVAEGLPSDHVNALDGDRHGSLSIGTSSGVARLRGDGTSTAPPGRGLHQTGITTMSRAQGLLNEEVAALHVDASGDVWVGTDSGLNRIHDGRVTASLTRRDGLPSDVVWSLVEDDDAALFIATAAGLARMKDGHFDVFTRRDGLSDDYLLHLSRDRAKNLWIATKGGGLNRYAKGRFQAFTTKDGLASDAISLTYEDRESNLWVGTFGNGLVRLKDGGLTAYTTRDGSPRLGLVGARGSKGRVVDRHVRRRPGEARRRDHVPRDDGQRPVVEPRLRNLRGCARRAVGRDRRGRRLGVSRTASRPSACTPKMDWRATSCASATPTPTGRCGSRSTAPRSTAWKGGPSPITRARTAYPSLAYRRSFATEPAPCGSPLAARASWGKPPPARRLSTPRRRGSRVTT